MRRNASSSPLLAASSNSLSGGVEPVDPAVTARTLDGGAETGACRIDPFGGGVDEFDGARQLYVEEH
jgi:hypothetical protein